LLGPQRLSGTGRQVFTDTLEAPLFDEETYTKPSLPEEKVETKKVTLSARRIRPTKAFAPKTWQSSTQQPIRDDFTATLVKFAETAVAEILNRTKRFLHFSK
uniref:INCENP_ARK-bind domain-containing protein n=2 Tax=Bursaphelenchus xylophilus TaxID=6326 RepID=A0A1I7SGZ9_BURXY